MREVHEGHYRNDSGGKSLVKKLLRTCYYWPRMEKDAENFVKKCDECQRYANQLHQPEEPLYFILSPWPFMTWRIDIVGSLKQSPKQVKCLLVLTDYFSKWVAEPLNKLKKRK